MAQISADSEASDLLAALSVNDNHKNHQQFNGEEEDSDVNQENQGDDADLLARATPNRGRRATAGAQVNDGSHLEEDDTDDEDGEEEEEDDDDDDDDSDSYYGDSDDEKMGGHNSSAGRIEYPRFDHHNSNYHKPLLPPQKDMHKGRLCVVLDMDETLIHSVFESAENNYRQDEERASTRHKHHFTVVVGTDEEVETAHVYKRPGLMRFMDELAKHCEVVVFTAALPVYAKPVLDKIDPSCHIVHRLYRDSTVTYRGQPFVKDLARLGRDLRKCVLVDNNPFALLATPDNAMPIQSFYDDPEDNELEKALQLLLEMSQLDDVRPYLQERFNFRQHLNELLRMSSDGY